MTKEEFDYAYNNLDEAVNYIICSCPLFGNDDNPTDWDKVFKTLREAKKIIFEEK